MAVDWFLESIHQTLVLSSMETQWGFPLIFWKKNYLTWEKHFVMFSDTRTQGRRWRGICSGLFFVTAICRSQRSLSALHVEIYVCGLVFFAITTFLPASGWLIAAFFFWTSLYYLYCKKHWCSHPAETYEQPAPPDVSPTSLCVSFAEQVKYLSVLRHASQEDVTLLCLHGT